MIKLQETDFLIHYENLACRILSVNFAEKMTAQSLFKQSLISNVDSSIMMEIFCRGSQELVFVFCQLFNKELNKFQFNALCSIYESLNNAVKRLYYPKQGIFIRGKQPQNSPLPKFIVRSISLLIGEVMKHIHLRLLQQKKKSAVSDFLQTIQKEQNQEYILYLFKCYMQAVSTIDHQLSYTEYRGLSVSFQQYIIPAIVAFLVDSPANYFEQIELQVSLKQLQSMQSQLDINDQSDENQKSQKKSKIGKKQKQKSPKGLQLTILKQNTCSELTLSLMNMISSYTYNIVYTEYQASESLFDHCLITFPQQVAAIIISKKFIQLTVTILKQILRYTIKLLNEYSDKSSVSTYKELSTIWQTLNKCIKMRVNEFQHAIINQFNKQIICGVIDITQACLQIDSNQFQRQRYFQIIKLLLESYKNIMVCIEPENIIPLQGYRIDQEVQDSAMKQGQALIVFVEAYKQLCLFCVSYFPICSQYAQIHNLSIIFWAQFQKSSTFVRQQFQSYLQFLGQSNNSQNLAPYRNIATKAVRTYLQAFLHKLYSQSILITSADSTINSSSITIQNIGSVLLQIFDGIQHLFLFCGYSNYDLLIELQISIGLMDNNNNRNQAHIIGTTNLILLFGYLVENYPSLEKHFAKYIPMSQKLQSNFIEHQSLICKHAFGMILKYICSYAQFQTQFIQKQASLLFISKALLQLVNNLTIQSSSNIMSALIIKYNDNDHYKYNDREQQNQQLIRVETKSQLYRHFLTYPKFSQINQKDMEFNSQISMIKIQLLFIKEHYSLYDLIDPNKNNNLELIIMWGCSYMLYVVIREIEKIGVRLQGMNGSSVQLIQQTYNILYSIISKIKWTIQRKNFLKTKIGVYLLSVFPKLLPCSYKVDTINVNHIYFQRTRSRLMKTLCMLMFDDYHDDYLNNMSIIASTVINTLSQALDKQDFMKFLAVIYDLIGILDALDTSTMWISFIQILEKQVKVGKLLDYLLDWATNLHNVPFKTLVIKDIIKLQWVFLANRCHRITGARNIYKDYEIICSFIPHWVIMLEEDCKQLKALQDNHKRNQFTKNSQTIYHEALFHVYTIFQSILKSNNINLSLLKKYSDKFQRFLSLTIEHMALSAQFANQSQCHNQKLEKIIKSLINVMWKVNFIDFMLKNSASETLLHFINLIVWNVEQAMQIMKTKVDQNSLQEIPIEIENPLQTFYQSLKILRKNLSYQHRINAIQVVRLLIAKIQQIIYKDPKQPNKPINFIEQLFVVMLKYLIKIMSVHSNTIYIAKLCSKLISHLMQFWLGKQRTQQIQIQKFGNQQQFNCALANCIDIDRESNQTFDADGQKVIQYLNLTYVKKK